MSEIVGADMGGAEIKVPGIKGKQFALSEAARLKCRVVVYAPRSGQTLGKWFYLKGHNMTVDDAKGAIKYCTSANHQGNLRQCVRPNIYKWAVILNW